jgi:hypothetical protein
MQQKTFDFSFQYHGETVKWDISKIDVSGFHPSNQDLKFCIRCNHPSFFSTFGWYGIYSDALRSVIDEGLKKKYDFFFNMMNSFKGFRD